MSFKLIHQHLPKSKYTLPAPHATRPFAAVRVPLYRRHQALSKAWGNRDRPDQSTPETVKHVSRVPNADNCAMNLSQMSDSIEQVVRMPRPGKGILEKRSWWSDSLENEQPSKAYQCTRLWLTFHSDPGSAMAMESNHALLHALEVRSRRRGGGGTEEPRGNTRSERLSTTVAQRPAGEWFRYRFRNRLHLTSKVKKGAGRQVAL
ncbi:uncharacterized protein K444DRAFT_255892 [Hyaloscypha bicolor E]|uniref:Uncharacterized protein n=1 Tax=Hyaloscypha bicolor E TaxID=1095630 RepID=A0A2J6SN53_9HELO|nr:uncharacterized protein K444DRAFT_255892 [Hyaloscypha bicolor E]PMD52195.1 hypothetical protein K444DRAFT_255892 [Hyaloscypha bicolor E]